MDVFIFEWLILTSILTSILIRDRMLSKLYNLFFLMSKIDRLPNPESRISITLSVLLLKYLHSTRISDVLCLF